MFARTYSQASRTNQDLSPLLASTRPRGWAAQLWTGLSLVLLIAATAWLASAHLLESWQFR